MTPSRFTIWVLKRVLRTDEADAAIGDIAEELEELRTAGRAPRWPRMWCERQALRYAALALVHIRTPLPNELRWAWRGIRQRGWRAALTVGLFAVALSANVLMFSISDSAVFHRLPYRDADHLLAIQSVRSAQDGDHINTFLPPPLFEAWRRQNDLFVGVEAYLGGKTTFVLGEGTADVVGTCDVTPGMLRLLGVGPTWGRTLAQGDEGDASLQVVVISEEFARRRFGQPSGALGQRIETTSMPLLVVGVMPSGFGFPHGRTDIWRAFDPRGPLARTFSGVETVVRIEASRSVASARELVETRSAVLGETAGIKGYRATVGPAGPGQTPVELRRLFYVLLGGALCFLLTACASVMSLEMAGAVGRARAFAIQTALGASRAGIVRVVLFEGGLMLAIAAALTSVLTWASTQSIVSLLPRFLLATPNRIDLDQRALLYLAAIAAIAWLIVSLPVALYGTRTDVSRVLSVDGRSASVSLLGIRIRRWLTSGQIAMAVCLVIVGGLYLRSYAALLSTDRGFDGENLAQVGFTIPPQFYEGQGEMRAFAERVMSRLRAVPGVAGVTYASAPPSFGESPFGGLNVEVDDRTPDPQPSAIGVGRVDPSYFSVIGIRLRSGRLLHDDDPPTNVVITDSLAKRFWPGQSPLGHRFRRVAREPWNDVVGVVSDLGDDPRRVAADRGRFFYFAPREPPPPVVAGSRPIDTGGSYKFMNVTARLDSLSRATAVMAAAQSVDRRLKVEFDAVDDAYAAEFGDMRMVTTLIGTFAGLAFLVAVVGVYGVMSYLVEARTREIGIRMALGADVGVIRRLVIGSSMWLVAVGACLGAGSAWSASRLIRGQLFEVSPLDPGTYALVVAVVTTTALVATWWPARRAAAIDPAVTLRAE